MMAQGHRKVNQIGSGGRSFVMRLPRAWADSVGVVNGSEVLVVSGFGSLLIIAPPGKEDEIGRIIKAAGGKS